MASQVIIRHACREDIPGILTLIQELAAYEHESESVQATAESLSKTLAFAPSGLVSPTNTNTNTTPQSTFTSTGDAISPTRPARCLLVFAPSTNSSFRNEPVGMALYFYNYSTWRASAGIYLEDLYVRESERGKGYGRKLLSILAKEVVEMEGARLEWSVLKWNEPSIKYYEGPSVGAKAMDGWQTMRVDGEALVKLARNAE
ncbi:N-acetyltransferase ats1 [Sclerotinia borealis F-4128]|uniref:N-acetyltransferase ats1 n=1 Tax=Sclerotinia borealis (strain F-4128) TaxID=1432307 RepID=W9CEM9_SCLBF|nr:N-acetyltransferase ats1 [Sclerotinia borealis F-4128]